MYIDETVEFGEKINISSNGILQNFKIEFEENFLIETTSGDQMSCTCIRHEKCCGCLLQ